MDLSYNRVSGRGEIDRDAMRDSSFAEEKIGAFTVWACYTYRTLDMLDVFDTVVT